MRRLEIAFDPVILFPCGHVFHGNAMCCPAQACQLCAKNSQMIIARHERGRRGERVELPTRRTQQLMRRMDFAVNSNYGDDSVKHARAVAAYFTPKAKPPGGRIIFQTDDRDGSNPLAMDWKALRAIQPDADSFGPSRQPCRKRIKVA
jgi:hypothetical protein